MPGIEEQEFIELFNDMYKPVRSYIYYRTGEMDVSDDIAQDVFVKLWDKRDIVKQETVKQFLYTIAGNLCKNRYNHEKVVLNFNNSFRDRVEEASPEFEMELKEFDKKLQKTISGLKEKNRVVFLMNRIDGYTYNQIADNLGISVKAVEKRMKNALDILRKKIEFKI